MRFDKINCWKLGHTTDAKKRLGEVNTHIPHEEIGKKWNLFRTQSWPNETNSYEMEQKLFELLKDKRTEGERIKCTEEDLHQAWLKAIGAA